MKNDRILEIVTRKHTAFMQLTLQSMGGFYALNNKTSKVNVE